MTGAWTLLLAGCASVEPSPSGDSGCVPIEELPYDGIDQDCDGEDLDDLDRDGSGHESDCDDLDPARYPGAEETPYDGIDQDCDGSDLDDLDGDGFGHESDCADLDPEIHPGAAELCDTLDQDCDGQVDEDASDALSGYLDADLDGYGDPGAPWEGCEALGPSQAGDCDDSDPRVHPGATEVCNGVDDDCEGSVDQMFAGLTHVTVQAALDAACQDGDTVWVTPGTYTETIEITRPLTLRATGTVDETVIDASACLEDDCPVVRVQADGVTLTDLTLQGGERAEGDGGGITSWEAEDLRVSGCRVAGNTAANGGGVAIYSGWIEDSQIDHNVALAYGGGVWLDNGGGAVTVSGTLIEHNAASYGGGAYAYFRSEVLWSANQIQDNTARLGGGLFLHGSESVSSGNQITRNKATQTNSFRGCGGGGVYQEGGDWSSSGDTVSGNSPDDTCQ